jgi:tetratricopeptide (TPR) repeat protein
MRALPLIEAANDPVRLARKLNNLGTVAYYQGKVAEAAPWYGKALEIAETVGDDVETAAVIVNLALLELSRGHPGRAQALVEPVLDHVRGHEYGEHVVQLALGAALLDQGKIPEASAPVARALELACELEDPVLIAAALEEVANYAARTRTPVLAARLLGFGMEVRRTRRDLPWPRARPPECRSRSDPA